MPLISPAYRGPLVIFAVGVGFAAVGAVPVAITFSLGARSSATIIGMGFVGFGFLLMLPGVFWCLMVRTHSFKTWRRRLRRGRTTDDDGQGTDDDDGEHTPSLHKSSDGLNGQYDKAATQRSKCWPPSYCDPPPLIITDYGVCRATTPTKHPAVDDPDPPGTDAEDPVDAEAGEPLCQRNSPVVVSVTVTSDDDIDDSQRLLAAAEPHVDTVPSVSSTDGTVPLCDA